MKSPFEQSSGLYNALVLSVLLYGCETWPLRAGEANNLNVFHHKCLHYILGLRLSDRVCNDVIRRRSGDIPLVSDVVKARRLRWFGHTLRQPDDSFSKQCFKCQPPSALEEKAWRTKKDMVINGQGRPRANGRFQEARAPME